MSAPGLPVLVASLDDYFECVEPRGKTTMKFRACLDRQTRTRKIASNGRIVHVNDFCAFKCALGQSVKAMFPEGATAAVTPPANLRMIPQYRNAPTVAPAASARVSAPVYDVKVPDPLLVPPVGRPGVRGTAQPSAKGEEERHAASAGKASATPDPGPVVITTPVPAAFRMTPEQVQASLRGVMTDRKCRCGCGRPLRKNNRSGWAGYCNAKRYAAGDRPSRAKGATMPTGKRAEPSPECNSTGTRHRGKCSKKAPPHARTGKPALIARGTARVHAGERVVRPPTDPEAAQEVAALTDDNLARLAQAAASEIDRRLSTLNAARKALSKAA